MNKLISIEFWIALQLFINIVLGTLLWRFVKKLKKIETDIQSSIKKEDLKSVTDSIHTEVVERIEKLISQMGEKAAVEMVDRAAKDIIGLLDPVVKDSESAAVSFEHQIKEKKRIIKNLNDAIDSRIISLNLLLSRTEAILNSKDKSVYQNTLNHNTQNNVELRNKSISNSLRNNALRNNNPQNRVTPEMRDRNSISYNNMNNMWSTTEYAEEESDLSDQQQKIIEWHKRGIDIDTIASELSMPRGEVQLVINLKSLLKDSI